MSQQTKEVPPPLSQDELRTLATQLKSLLIEFQEFDIPNALGHLDLNPATSLSLQIGVSFLIGPRLMLGIPS